MNIGQYVGLSVNLADAKKEALHASSDPGNTIIIRFSDNDITLGKVIFVSKNELRYQGKLYDIAAMDRQGHAFSARVFHDEKEEGFISELQELVHTWLGDPAKNPNRHQSFKLASLIQDIIPSAKVKYLFADHAHMVATVDLQLSFSYPVLDIVKSPPRLS